MHIQPINDVSVLTNRTITPAWAAEAAGRISSFDDFCNLVSTRLEFIQETLGAFVDAEVPGAIAAGLADDIGDIRDYICDCGRAVKDEEQGVAAGGES